MSQGQAARNRGPDVSLRATLRRLEPFIRPILPRLLTGFLCALGAAVIALAIPQVLSWLVNTVIAAHGTAEQVWLATAVLGALGFLEALLFFLRRQFVLAPAARLETEMRIRFFTHLQRLPMAFHDRWGSGQLLSRSMSDLSLLRRWLAFGAMMLIVDTGTVLVGVGLMVYHSPLLALFYVIGAIPISFRAFKFRNTFRAVSRLSQDQAGDLATTVEESVHGIRVIKAFGRGPHMFEGFKTQAEALRATELTKARTLSGFLMTVVAVPEIFLGMGLVLGLVLCADGRLSVGSLVAYFATAAVLARPVEGMGMLLGMTLTTKTALDRHFEVMDSRNDITDPDTPGTAPGPAGALELRHVRFTYPDETGTARPVLQDVSLSVRPGETMALVGMTGSGKSTLLNLIPRLHEVGAGAVLVDGLDVRRWDLAELRTTLAVAFEDTTLFSTSVRENVLLGAPGHLDAHQLDVLLASALDTAEAQFAHRLPQGVDTLIGEEGLSLSGGQRQRLALARAIAARPRILILDDPLSALDVRTEEAVTAKLRTVLQGTTTLVVAHRPSTVMLADRVAVLRDGRIDAVGRHSDLLATSEHYRYVITSLQDEQAGLESGMTGMTGNQP